MGSSPCCFACDERGSRTHRMGVSLRYFSRSASAPGTASRPQGGPACKDAARGRSPTRNGYECWNGRCLMGARICGSRRIVVGRSSTRNDAIPHLPHRSSREQEVGRVLIASLFPFAHGSRKICAGSPSTIPLPSLHQRKKPYAGNPLTLC